MIQVPDPDLVIFELRRVVLAVQLDDEPTLEVGEVDDVGARCVPLELGLCLSARLSRPSAAHGFRMHSIDDGSPSGLLREKSLKACAHGRGFFS